MICREMAISSLRPGATWYSLNGVITWEDKEQTQPSEDEIDTEFERLKNLEPWNELRAARNLLLAETDYLALSDSTLTDDMKTYRQALRDLPANTTDPANPAWPTKPEG